MGDKEVLIERPDSCEVSVNAKGLYSGKIKAYAKTLEDAMAIALSKAEEMEGIIKRKNGI